MNFNHSNAADFDAPPGTEIVLHNNEGLDDVNELPFGNASFFGRNRNKLIIVGMTAAVVLFVSGTSIAVSRNNRIASNFATVNACKSSKLQAPKQSKSPKQSKALKQSPQGEALNSIVQSQLYALLVLYYATNGDSWDDNNDNGWLDFSQSECGWYGVTCNDENIVTKLELGDNSLSGSIPTEIGLLKSLEQLVLYDNQLTGTIPSDIGLMVNLEYLSLNNNTLTGTIPSEIGSMVNLAELDLSKNQLTGAIPSEIGLMGNLEQLVLYYNDLTGTIPSDIGLMENLEAFVLNFNNDLTGPIPSEVCALRPPGQLAELFADCSVCEKDPATNCCNKCF